jgi:hypothetical protein
VSLLAEGRNTSDDDNHSECFDDADKKSLHGKIAFVETCHLGKRQTFVTS